MHWTRQPNRIFSTLCKLRDCLARTHSRIYATRSRCNRPLQAAQPDIVFHLAAQSLVRHSYTAPVETYAVNVMGTVNLLEAVRQTPAVKAVVNITSDKCYENREWIWPYRENEAMGGYDPYSSSKACSELVTSSYRRSFLALAETELASARAGNVIGGGDWATDRLVPDFLRAVDDRQCLTIRSPLATRPWQHVLEPLSGYIMLAEKLYNEGSSYADAWNFGPDENDIKTVGWLADRLCRMVPGATWQQDELAHPHEAHELRLDSSRARKLLDWIPRWQIEKALENTVAWHLAWKNGDNMAEHSLAQIHEHEESTIT